MTLELLKNQNSLALKRKIINLAKPAQDQLKMNCDAAVGMEHSYVAVVVRDCRGTLVFA